MATIATTDAATARERLHHIIDEIEDERVIGLYIAFSSEIGEDWEYPAELKAQLDEDYEAVKNGEKTYSKEEILQSADALLKQLGIRK